MAPDSIGRAVSKHPDTLLACALAAMAQVEIWAAETLTLQSGS